MSDRDQANDAQNELALKRAAFLPPDGKVIGLSPTPEPEVQQTQV